MAIELVTKDEKVPTRTRSKAQEIQIANATGGKRTPNSGATDFSGKGDVLTDKFLLEAKTKMEHSKQITIKKEWFEKNKQEMAMMGKPYSAVVFNFGPNEENYYVIDESLFIQLLEAIENDK